MLIALIMAGGKGTRFWPLSTEEKPKQFLDLIGDKTMIQMTIDRIKPIIPIDRVFVCTGERYVDLVKAQLPELPERNIIIEPIGRNTAPCIALSALVVNRYYKDATMVVLPSDHIIRNEDRFREIIQDADMFVKENNEAIITFGMKPSRAETGYGYIRCGRDIRKVNNNKVIKVDYFAEKPNQETADDYLRSGKYLWNGGMFLWSTENILNQIRKYSIETYETLHGIQDVDEDKLQQLINERYVNSESISIDYAVLEKSKDVYVIPSEIGWDDVGSWSAINRYQKRDSNNNIYMGDIIDIDTSNNLVISNDNKIIIDGLSDIYIISKNEHIFIGRKENIERINNLKKMI